MPNVILPVKSTYQAAARYAAHNVVANIMRMTGIEESTPVFYANSQGHYLQPGTAIDQNKEPLFSQSRRLNIVVTEEYEENSIINTPIRDPEERFIFQDLDLGVYLKPVYSYTSVAIVVNYKAENRLETETWRDKIKVQLGNNRQAHLHELDFHYPVPKEALVILKDIHTKREAIAGYNASFGEYLKNHFTEEATTLTTQGGTEPLLVIRQKQIGVQGWFEFTEPVDGSKDDDGPAWSISFTYRFEYRKPIAAVFAYPVIIHQQLIDSDFFARKPMYALETRPHYAGMFLTAGDAINESAQLAESTIGGVRIPVWDEWLPGQIPANTSTVLTVISILSPEDPQSLGDLMALEWVWQPAFEKFFKAEAEHVHVRGGSFVYVHLYADALPVEDNPIRVTDQLTVSAVEPLDLRRTYRLRVSLVTDIRLLHNRAIQSMMDNGNVTLILFRDLMPHMDMEEGMRNILADGSLRRSYIERFFAQYKDWVSGGRWDGSGMRGSVDFPVEVNRIMQLSIIAKRQQGETK